MPPPKGEEVEAPKPPVPVVVPPPLPKRPPPVVPDPKPVFCPPPKTPPPVLEPNAGVVPALPKPNPPPVPDVAVPPPKRDEEDVVLAPNAGLLKRELPWVFEPNPPEAKGPVRALILLPDMMKEKDEKDGKEREVG